MARLLLAVGPPDGRAHEAQGHGGAPPLLRDDEAGHRERLQGGCISVNHRFKVGTIKQNVPKSVNNHLLQILILLNYSRYVTTLCLFYE